MEQKTILDSNFFEMNIGQVLRKPRLILDYFRNWFKEPMKTIDTLNLNEEPIEPTILLALLSCFSAFISSLSSGDYIWILYSPAILVIKTLLLSALTFVVCVFFEKHFTLRQLYIFWLHIGLLFYPLSFLATFVPFDNVNVMLFVLEVLLVIFILKNKKVVPSKPSTSSTSTKDIL